MANLVTLADVKTFLQIGFSTDDALLNQLIVGYSAAIESYCKRSLSGVVAQTDIFDGGSREFILPGHPAVSITSITDRIDASVVDPMLYDLDAGGGMVMAGTPSTQAVVGVIDVAIFARSQGEQLWGFGRRRWQVAYTHGYASVPLDVKQAAFLLISARYNRRDELSEEQVGDYSYHAETGDKSGWSPQVEQLLSNYSDPVVG